MINEGKFGVQEAICLITITIVVKAFYTSPSAVTQAVGTAGWYMTLISAGGGIIGFTFVYFLLKRFPDKNIVEIYETVMGKAIGSFFSLILGASLIYAALSNITESTYVVQVYTLPTSPPSFVIGLFIMSITVFCFLGLESLARFSRLTAYVLLVGFISVIVLASQSYSMHRLYPIFGYGIDRTIYHGLLRSSVYGDVIVLAVITKCLQGVKNIKIVGFVSLILSGIVISIALLAFSLSFPFNIGQELTAPMYVLASLINYGRFFQRLESIFLYVWFISSFIAATALFYTGLLTYCQVFKIQDKKPVVIPFSIILFSLCMLPSSITTVIKVIVPVYREYIWITYFIPPIITLVIAKLMKKGEIQNA